MNSIQYSGLDSVGNYVKRPEDDVKRPWISDAKLNLGKKVAAVALVAFAGVALYYSAPVLAAVLLISGGIVAKTISKVEPKQIKPKREYSFQRNVRKELRQTLVQGDELLRRVLLSQLVNPNERALVSTVFEKVPLDQRAVERDSAELILKMHQLLNPKVERAGFVRFSSNIDRYVFSYYNRKNLDMPYAHSAPRNCKKLAELTSYINNEFIGVVFDGTTFHTKRDVLR